MPKTETVYDSTEMQLESLTEMVSGKFTLEDLARPEIVVRLILERNVVNLTDLKTVRSEVTELRDTVSNLTQERENLRIDLVKSRQRQSILWLEIPLSFLSAFAVNMLTATPPNRLGWALLIVCLMMLLFLRLPELRTSITQLLVSRKEESRDA
jgi:hypothetical protein